MRSHLLKNEKMLKEVDTVMLALEKEVNESSGNLHMDDRNPQTAYAKSKTCLGEIIQKYARVSIP